MHTLFEINGALAIYFTFGRIMEPWSQIVTATVNIVEDGDIVSATADMRVNLSYPHLLSAAMFSRRLGELETDNAGKELGAFWDDILANATGAVLTSVAALESYANELFIDHAKIFPELRLEVMAKLWELYEQKPPFEKYEFALLIKYAQKFNRGGSPYQDVAALVKLRNGLTHFKPEWFSQQVEHARLSGQLSGKAQLSPFFPSTEPLFPRGWASHASTVWAVKSVVTFILEFEKRAGITNRMDQFANRFDAL